MLTGLVFTYGYIEYFKGLFLKWAGSPWGENVAENWLFGISPEGIGVIGMLLNFAVAHHSQPHDERTAGTHPAHGGTHSRTPGD